MKNPSSKWTGLLCPAVASHGPLLDITRKGPSGETQIVLWCPNAEHDGLPATPTRETAVPRTKAVFAMAEVEAAMAARKAV